MSKSVKFIEVAKDLPKSIHIESNLDDFDVFINNAWPSKDVNDLFEKIVLIQNSINKHFGMKTESHIFISKPDKLDPSTWFLMFSLKTVYRPEAFVEKLSSFDISDYNDLPVDFGRYYYSNFDPSIYDFVGSRINQ